MSNRRDRPPASPAMRRKTYAMRLIAASIIMTCPGCGDSKSPVQATPVLPSPAPGPVSVVGQVNDTADRPLADVRVEVVDGLSAGVFTTTNTVGHFELSGVSEPFTVRATKEGYVPFTTTRSMQYGPLSIWIVMALSTPSVNMTGDYTLTLTADTACSGNLPDVARSRTYTVSMTSIPNTPENYRAVLGGATFLSSEAGQFLVDVAGTYAHFRFGDFYEDGSIIIEEVAPSTYLGITGSVGLTVNGGTTISGSFRGGFDYCVNPNPAAIVNYQCPVGQHVFCNSTNQRMLLVRR